MLRSLGKKNDCRIYPEESLVEVLSDKSKQKKNDDDELSFLESTKEIDVENQLRFDILKDVYLTKKKEAEDLRIAADIKAHNQKIDTLIAEKQEGKLREMSIEDLEKLHK